MIITIVAVHPTVTIVRQDDGQFELPTNLFPATPKEGQRWSIALSHQPTEAEAINHLNGLLIRD